jgi:hypothetical protein
MVLKKQKAAVVATKKKGGVGASTMMSAMATVLRATLNGDSQVRVVDGDAFNGTLIQRIGERDESGTLLAAQSVERGVIKADLFDRDGVRPIFEAVESDADIVLIDTPAGSLDRFEQLSVNLNARDFIGHVVACGRTPIVVVPFTPAGASIRAIKVALDRFGEGARFVAARNMVGHTERDYRLWSTEAVIDRFGAQVGGRTRTAFEAAGGRVIEMPAADAGTLSVAEALKLSFAEAAGSIWPGTVWQQWDRLNMGKWLQAWVVELQKIDDWLGLEDANWRAF